MQNDNVNEVLVRGILGKPRKNNRGEQCVPVYIEGNPDYNLQFVTRGNMDVTLRPGDYVDVTGRTIGYNYFDREQKRTEHVQFFVADEIKRAETDLHSRFGVYGGYRTNTFAKVYLAGTVSYVSKREQWGRIGVQVENDNGERPYVISVSMFASGYRMPAFDFEKGDKVCIVATVRQKTKRLEGKMVRFENINVEDIVATEKVPREKKEKTIIKVVHKDDIPETDTVDNEALPKPADTPASDGPSADDITIGEDSSVAAETAEPLGFSDMVRSGDEEEDDDTPLAKA